jgi:hypothetical protein
MRQGSSPRQSRGVDGETGSRRRLEADREIDRAEIPVMKCGLQDKAEPRDRCLDRSDSGATAGAELKRNAVAVSFEPDVC